MRRVALLVNRNAQGARPRVIDWLRARLGDDLFVTATFEEARAAAATIFGREYRVVCVGGGDGTFMQLARDLIELAPPCPPALFPLRLGTGNAIADVSGAAHATREGLAHDLARAAGDPPVAPLKLLDVDGRVTHFAGLGLDALWADDYQRLVKERLGRAALLPVVRGAPGYVLTALTRTIPRLVVRPRITVRAVAVGPAEALDTEGREAGVLAAGAVLFDGEAMLAAASTVRSYSAGLAFFPFAERLAGRFQLRVATNGLLTALAALRRLYAGTYRDGRRIHDFAATGVRFEVPAPVPWHLGGDVQPAATGFTVRLSARNVLVVRPSA